MIYDYVILGSRRFKEKANKIGNNLINQGYTVKLIGGSVPRIETDGKEVLKKFKTQYQKEHFEAIRLCKKGVILCNFNGYIGLNTKAELILANAYNVSIFAIEPLNSKEEEIQILNVHSFDFLEINKK